MARQDFDSRAPAPRLQALLLLAMVGACAGPQLESDAKIAQIENGLRPWVLVEGDATWSIEQRMREHHVPGVSIAVFRDGKILWAKAYGVADLELSRPVSPQTLFQAGSISKPVAAMGALVLVERDQLALGADINASLKSWQVPSNEFTRTAPVTLEGLLSHTAGLTVHGFPGYEAGTQVPGVVQVLDGEAPTNTAPVRVDVTPGTQWRYSGGGYTVVQLAMTDVTGMPFPRLMDELVLQPLGMSRSTYDQPLPDPRLAEAAAGYHENGSAVRGKRNVYPEQAAAGLWTTASDLAAFAMGLQGMLRGEQGPLSQAMAENMVRVRRDHYGLGFWCEDPYFTHSGADEGFRAFLYAHKTEGYGVVVMTNSDSGMELMQEIWRSVGAAYAWDEFEAGPVKPARLSLEELTSCVGRYELDHGAALAFSVRGSSLEGQQPLGPTFELVPVSAGRFVRRDEDAEYVFGPEGLRLVQYRDSPVLPRLAEDVLLPDEDLEAGRLDAALAGYRKLRAADPSDPAVAQERLIRHGRTLLERNDLPAALAVLQLNAEFHDNSANAQDGFAEAAERIGNTAEAIRLYRKALELALRPSSPDSFDHAKVRSHASERLKTLDAGR